MRIWGSLRGVKRPDREADHSDLSRDEVKNAPSYSSNATTLLHEVVLS